MKGRSFKVYVVRLLKNIDQEIRLTKTSVEAIDSIIRILAEKIVDRALVLTANDDKKTISAREIYTATQMILPANFSDDAVALSNVSITKYTESESEQKVQTRESRCGLIFSVSTSEKYVRKFGQVGFNVSATTPVALAAILQYFATYLLQKSITMTKESKKITITIRHLFLAIATDPLLDFVNNLGVILLEGGVKPQDIQNKQHKRTKRSNTERKDEKKVHRWRPGTKTIMEIRRLQKSGDMLMQHAPFNNLVREILENMQLKFRMTGEFCITLQAFAEDRLINLMQRANKIALHSSRETVYSKDIELVCDLAGESVEEVNVKTIIPESALRQMALRAAIQRFGDCSVNTYRNYLVNMLSKYLKDIVTCARHHKIQTLNTRTILEAMGMRGLYPSIIHHKRRVIKKANSEKQEETNNEETTPEQTEQVA